MRNHSIPRLLTSQLTVSACLSGLLAWGAATAACVPPLLAALGPQDWLDAVTLSALMGLYLAMLIFIVALAACLLGCLPLYLLAQIASWMLPPGWRRALWGLYLCPIIAYALAITWLPVWLGQSSAVAWVGGLFAAIPTLVLVSFHLWVVAPPDRASVLEGGQAKPGYDVGLAPVLLERPTPVLELQTGVH